MVLSMSILFPKFHACQAKTKQTKTKEEQAFVSEWHPPFNIHRKKIQ